MGHTLELRPCELREQTAWQLHTTIEEANKGSQGDRVSQPGLSENGVVLSQMILDGSCVPSTNGTTECTYINISAVLSC